MSSSRPTRSELNSWPTQKLKAWLTRQDQRLPRQDREKSYYVDRILTYVSRLPPADSDEEDGTGGFENNDENHRMNQGGPGRRRRRATMVEDSTRPGTRQKGRVVSTHAEKRRHSQVAQNPPQSPSIKVTRVKMIPASKQAPKSPALSRQIKRTRDRMRRNTVDRDALDMHLREAQLNASSSSSSESENNHSKKGSKKWEIPCEAAFMTVDQLKRWLNKHKIPYEPRGKKKIYFVQLVERHSFVKQSRPPLPSNIRHSPLTPSKKTKTVRPPKHSSPPRNSVNQSFLHTPALLKRGPVPFTNAEKNRMRDDIRSMLADCDESPLQSPESNGNPAFSKQPNGFTGMNTRRKIVNRFTSDFSPESVEPPGISKQNPVEDSPAPIYAVPVIQKPAHSKRPLGSRLHRGSMNVPMDSPLRQPAQRVLRTSGASTMSDQSTEDEAGNEDIRESEDEIDTDYEESQESGNEPVTLRKEHARRRRASESVVSRHHHHNHHHHRSNNRPKRGSARNASLGGSQSRDTDSFKDRPTGFYTGWAGGAPSAHSKDVAVRDSVDRGRIDSTNRGGAKGASGGGIGTRVASKNDHSNRHAPSPFPMQRLVFQSSGKPFTKRNNFSGTNSDEEGDREDWKEIPPTPYMDQVKSFGNLKRVEIEREKTAYNESIPLEKPSFIESNSPQNESQSKSHRLSSSSVHPNPRTKDIHSLQKRSKKRGSSSSPSKSICIQLLWSLTIISFVALIAIGVGFMMREPEWIRAQWTELVTNTPDFNSILTSFSLDSFQNNVASPSIPLFCDSGKDTIMGLVQKPSSPENPLKKPSSISDCLPCPQFARSCSQGIASCMMGRVLDGTECVIDEIIVRQSQKIKKEIESVLGSRLGDHLCGEDIQPFMNEDTLILHLSDKFGSPPSTNPDNPPSPPPSQNPNKFTLKEIQSSLKYLKTSKNLPSPIYFDSIKRSWHSNRPIKSFSCQGKEWFQENAILIGIIGASFLALIMILFKYKSYQRNKILVKNLHMQVYEILVEREISRSAFPFVKVDSIYNRLNKPSQKIWNELNRLISVDLNIQKSMRMIDGLQKRCWSISQNAEMGLRSKCLERKEMREKKKNKQNQIESKKQASQNKDPIMENEPSINSFNGFKSKRDHHSVFSTARQFDNTPGKGLINPASFVMPQPNDMHAENSQQNRFGGLGTRLGMSGPAAATAAASRKW